MVKLRRLTRLVNTSGFFAFLIGLTRTKSAAPISVSGRHQSVPSSCSASGSRRLTPKVSR